MIGYLPNQIEFENGTTWAIRSDFRIALLIFNLLNDKELKQNEKIYLMLDAFYEEFEEMPEENWVEACNKASLFLDGTEEETQDNSKEKNPNNIKLLDWEKDEKYIFSAINRVAGMEVRSLAYMHWWTFLGYFYEIGSECMISNLMFIRNKKAKGKKLSKEEEIYYRENKELIDIEEKLDKEEIQARKQEMEFLNQLLN